MTALKTNYKDKVILITGASRGFGAALAKSLAAKNAQLILTARNQAALEEIDDDIFSISHQHATLLPLNLCHHEQFPALSQAIYDRFGKLDCFIGNAAIFGGYHPIGHIKHHHWQKLVDTNITANLHLLQNLTPLLKQSKYGRVVMLSSQLTDNPPAFASCFHATKAALEAIVKSYAKEIDNITNIKANIYRPNKMQTASFLSSHPGVDTNNIATADMMVDGIYPLLADDCSYNGDIIDG